MADWFSKEFVQELGHLINEVSCLRHVATAKVINAAVGTTRNRPHPWSTFRPYTSWQGLTDRTFLARHLPKAAQPTDLPKSADLLKLFCRPEGSEALSGTSTCLFPAFAQYLTDGFIRTDPSNLGKTTSNHEIDLCPLYGRTPAQTAVLRLNSTTAVEFGRLKSQQIANPHGDDEEYAPYLYEPGTGSVRAQYVGTLDPVLGADNLNLADKATMFAFGGDRANSTMFTAMLNTLLLREHNRVAGEIQSRNPAWDDDRVFETTRNVMIPVFINIVIEEYINHIAPLPFKLISDPSVAWTADWNRPNWMTVEFSLLYRWHSLMPDQIKWSSDEIIDTKNFKQNNAPLTRVGLEAAFEAASKTRAGVLGAFNTAAALLPIEAAAVEQGRFNKLDTYNNYRIAFGRSAARTFADISSREEVQAELQRLYGTVDRVEFYPGLFAEDLVDGSPLPELILRMVAVDAFSQALTNPLLSQHVFNPLTFTDYGWQTIQTTHSLADLVARNVPKPTPGMKISMSQA